MTLPHCDVLVVTPPFSPFDAGPPLGPATLKAYAHEAGFLCGTMDLNIRFLQRFRWNDPKRQEIIGDHAKDHKLVQESRTFFRQHLHLPVPMKEDIPCCTDPELGLPHDWNELEIALQNMSTDWFWQDFYEQHLFGVIEAPSILGLSIMGPAQVLPACTLATLAVRKWPNTFIIAGGSHITLLQEQISKDNRFGQNIHAFFPGHSEQTLIDFLQRTQHPESNFQIQASETTGVLIAGKKQKSLLVPHPKEKLPPYFEKEELDLYAPDRVSLPVQFGKGCSYSKCTMCTYPAVESFEKVKLMVLARRYLPALQHHGIPRLSVKDSLFDLPSLRGLSTVNQELGNVWTWSATTKLLLGMTRSQMQYLFAGGCRTLEFGVETIHPKMQQILEKHQPLPLIEGVLEACIEAGIAVVINLIYGLPEETEKQAVQQWEWFMSWHNRAPHLITGSHNMLEVNRGSPMAKHPHQYGILLGGIGPWSFSYRWNAPLWRPDFSKYLREQHFSLM